MNKEYRDKRFGELVSKLSPASMHRLINLLRKELEIDVAKENIMRMK